MGRNAQRRRLRKAAATLKARGLRAPSTPIAYLRLIGKRGYLVEHFGLSQKAAREALVEGKVNINGEVWSYPDVPRKSIEVDRESGRLRIMVEGVPDPRPAMSGAVTLRKRASG